MCWNGFFLLFFAKPSRSVSTVLADREQSFDYAEGSMKILEPLIDEVMDYRGLSVYLKYAQGTLRHWVMRKEIPHIKIGKSVRFYKKHIDAWLEENCRVQKRRQAGGTE